MERTLKKIQAEIWLNSFQLQLTVTWIEHFALFIFSFSAATDCENILTYFRSIFPFYTPENVRKSIFFCFKGYRSKTLAWNRLKKENSKQNFTTPLSNTSICLETFKKFGTEFSRYFETKKERLITLYFWKAIGKTNHSISSWSYTDSSQGSQHSQNFNTEIKVFVKSLTTGLF